MDSDDNCLVIDEDTMDMEVSSTTPNRSEPTATRIEKKHKRRRENDADSFADESTAINKSAQKVTSDSRYEEKRIKTSRERNSEKRKSKDDRRKSSTLNIEKPRTPKGKQYTIRLTKSIFDENALNITAQKHQLYNMQFYHRKGHLVSEMPLVYPAPPAFPELSLTQLLNWPDIKMNINLDHLAFSHEIKQNCVRDLVFGDEVLIGIDLQKNPTETRYLQKVPTTKTYPMVSKDVFDVYVRSLMNVAPLYDVGKSKLPEIEHSFQKILDDVASVPFNSIQTRMTHSRFLDEQKYYCVFDNSSTDDSSSSNLKVRLRETINPEVNFNLKKCTFRSDQIDVWHEALAKELEDILVIRSNKMKDALRDRFKKCLVLKCEKCNEIFEGPLWAVKLKDHIKQKHFVDKKWSCVKCQRKWDQFELLNMGWKHDCNTGV